jgi:hypothetical protein
MMTTSSDYLVYEPSKMSEEEICQYAFQCVSRWEQYYELAQKAGIQNLNFVYKDQWDATSRGRRNAANKPSYQNNFILPIQRKLVAEQRQAQPDIVTIPKSNEVPPTLSKIYEGIYRQVSYESDTEIIYSKCYEDMLDTGAGALLCDVMQEEDGSLHNKLSIPYIQDIMRCGWDPAAQSPYKTDGDFCFIYTIMSRKEFCRLYPDLEAEFMSESVPEGMNGYASSNMGKDDIMLLNIWCREYYNIKRVMLENGTEMDRKEYNQKEKDMELENFDGKVKFDEFIKKIIAQGAPEEMLPKFSGKKMPKVKKQQKVVKSRIHHYLLTRHHILEQSTENEKVQKLPLVYSPGEVKTIDGKVLPMPFAAVAQTAQSGVNYCFSEMMNSLNKTFTPKIMATPAMVANNPHIMNDPDISQTFIYNIDPANPSAVPGVLAMPQVDNTLLTLYQQFQNDVRMLLGRNDENLGQQSNAQSGIAIGYRQFAGDLSVGPYNDNLIKAIGELARVMFERIPYTYDTERTIQIRGRGGESEFVNINSPAYELDEKGGMRLENELAKGKFDVEVKGGSSFMSQRLSVINLLSQFARMDLEKLGPLTYDYIAELFPIIDSYSLVKRIQETVTPPQVIEMEEGKRPKPPQPTPEQQALMIKQKADLLKAMADMMNAKTSAEDAKFKALNQAAELKLEREKIKAEVAESYLELEKAKVESLAGVAEAAIEAKDKQAERDAKVLLSSVEAESKLIDSALKIG